MLNPKFVKTMADAVHASANELERAIRSEIEHNAIGMSLHMMSECGQIARNIIRLHSAAANILPRGQQSRSETVGS